MAPPPTPLNRVRPPLSQSQASALGGGTRAAAFRLGPADITLYRAADYLTTPLILFVVIFGPWAFGTTQPWSIWTLNCANYTVGALFLAKVWVRRFKGYQPGRWLAAESGTDLESPHRAGRCVVLILAAATLLVLAYTLVSALNARATWNPAALSFDYHDAIPWLPHSLDSASSWSAFWNYLGLAAFFWALRDWLLGKSDAEQRLLGPAVDSSSHRLALTPSFPLPQRLRILLWVLAINGALLAGEGIVQRFEGSGKLLFLVKPRVNPGADTQFGPWAYRSNAAQYFNLLWPLCLVFWWTLNRSPRIQTRKHHLLLFCALLIAVSPLMSTSRGGALVTVGIIILSGFFLLAAHVLLRVSRQENPQRRRRALAALGLFFGLTLAAGLLLGWKSLQPRMQELHEGFTLREEMYDLARPMARDYPAFGTGPGTFESVFQLYRITTDTYWPAQLHNDWLETRITFGWIGSSLIALAFLAAIARWFFPGGIHGGRRFVILTYMALAGCLLHARFDFPFQIHSVLTLFLTLCAILSVLTRRPAK